MNDQNEHPVLLAVAVTIADGLPVDWDSLLAEYPELAEDLNTLRVLQGVETAGRGGDTTRGK